MNFSHLLQQRAAIQRQARLANFAFACHRLGVFTERITAAGLGGVVTLHPADIEAGRFVPTLVAHERSQAAIDEHFLDEDIIELADILQFLEAEGCEIDQTFDLAEMPWRCLVFVCAELEKGGVILPRNTAQPPA